MLLNNWIYYCYIISYHIMFKHYLFFQLRKTGLICLKQHIFSFDFGVKFEPEMFLTGWDCLLTKETFTALKSDDSVNWTKTNVITTQRRPGKFIYSFMRPYGDSHSHQFELGLWWQELLWFGVPAESCWLVLQHSQEDLSITKPAALLNRPQYCRFSRKETKRYNNR